MRLPSPRLPWRSVSLVLAVLLLLPLLPAQQSPPSQRPKLVVVLVVDQMRADYVARFRGEWHGGLARLLDQGAWFRNAAYPYSGTETCPGHATISTGVFPEAHGIISNAWWDRTTANTVTCTQDSAVRDVGISRAASPGNSPARLMAPGFAERLRAAQPGSRVVSISLKARSAIMLAGHRADVVLWLDEFAGDWRTSSAYASEIPAFARDFVAQHPLSADADKVWELTLHPNVYKAGPSSAGEAPPAGWTTAFPHPLAGNSSTAGTFLGRWRASPFSDAYLQQLAVAAVHSMNLGRGPATDFLAIGFSAPDYVGHAFGPDSREIEDMYLRLDKTIGNLLDELDRTVGAGNYVVALTGDHGVAPIPEQSRQAGKGGRVKAADIVAAVEETLGEHFDPQRPVIQMVDKDIYFEPVVMQRIHADPELWQDIRKAVEAIPGVQRVFHSKELLQRSGSGALARATALDEFPGRSGDLTISLKPYWILSSGGTTHGSANDYDQRVPLILYGAGIRRGVYTAKSSPADIAPTLAALCGVPAAPAQGRILAEAIRPDTAAVAR